MKERIPLFTTNEPPAGYRVVRTLGLARGNAVRARAITADIMAVIRLIIGGEILEYTKMLAETREHAIDRMIDEAEESGANAILGIRFVTAQTMAGAAEFLVYGTAVIIEPS